MLRTSSAELSSDQVHGRSKMGSTRTDLERKVHGVYVDVNKGQTGTRVGKSTDTLNIVFTGAKRDEQLAEYNLTNCSHFTHQRKT